MRDEKLLNTINLKNLSYETSMPKDLMKRPAFLYLDAILFQILTVAIILLSKYQTMLSVIAYVTLLTWFIVSVVLKFNNIRKISNDDHQKSYTTNSEATLNIMNELNKVIIENDSVVKRAYEYINPDLSDSETIVLTYDDGNHLVYLNDTLCSDDEKLEIIEYAPNVFKLNHIVMLKDALDDFQDSKKSLFDNYETSDGLGIIDKFNQTSNRTKTWAEFEHQSHKTERNELS